MSKFICLAWALFAPLWLHAIDREAFTFTRYDLEVRVEPEQQRIGVRGKIALRNDSASAQKSLSLQISSSLNWSSIRFENQPVEFVSQTYTSDIDHTGALSEAIVVLPRAIAPKQSVELDIGYEGVIPLDATRLTRIGVPADTAKHTDWDHIGRTFSAVRGIGYVDWYPMAMEAVSLSDGDAVPEALTRWQEREDSAEMKAVFAVSGSSGDLPKLLCNAPVTELGYEQGISNVSRTQCNFSLRHSALFSTGNFAALDRPAVNIEYLPEHKQGADDYASAEEELTPLLTKWFGDHREATQAKAEVVDQADSQAATYESRNVLLMPLNGGDTKLLMACTQQLTHLFFPSPQLWIHDGLASYAQARLIEEKESPEAAIAYLEGHRSGLLDLEKRDANDAEPLAKARDEFAVQVKAMYVWWMLRDMVGDDVLAAALHSYKASADNSPGYLQKLIEAQSHRDLQWFFDDWVYHDRGLPDFRITSVFSSKLPSGGYMNTVTVENSGGAAAEVPVTLHREAGEVTQRLIVPGHGKASVRIESAATPQRVTVNDGSVPETDISNNEYRIESSNHDH